MPMLDGQEILRISLSSGRDPIFFRGTKPPAATREAGMRLRSNTPMKKLDTLPKFGTWS